MPAPRFQRLVIFGVGLLGGSIGLAARSRGMAGRIVGLGRSLERLESARSLGAIDECQTDPAMALLGADALVLCVPPRQIRELWPELAPLIQPQTFVTDVGSVKARIVEEAEKHLSPEVLFVGSHPMAGSEKTGAEHGSADFYEGAACILTPSDKTHPEALELAQWFWSTLGSRLIITSPARHDRILAGISHLPHLAASALISTLDEDFIPSAELAEIAGNGLRDTTRIAASDPGIWEQIFTENQAALLGQLDDYLELLQQWRAILAQPTPDRAAMRQLYATGQRLRQNLNQNETRRQPDAGE